MSSQSILARRPANSSGAAPVWPLEAPRPQASAQPMHMGSLGEAIWRDSLEPMRVTDALGLIVDVNDAYCRLVGMERADLVGQPFDVVYGPELDHAVLIEKYRRRFEERKMMPMMGRAVPLATGKEVFLEASSSFITLDDGSVCVLSIARDNTVHRNFEESLRASESRYRSLTEYATDAIVTCHADGLITSWNGAAAGMFGYDAAESLGHPVQMLVPERFRHLTTLAFGRMRIGAEARTIHRTVELFGQRRTGEEFPIELSFSSWLTIDGPSFSIIIRDITVRRKIEEQLRISEQRYTAIFDHAVQGMFQSTPEGGLILANKALLNLLGYDSCGELAAVNMADLYVDPEQRSQYLAQLAAQGSCYNFELTLRRKDGRLITVLEHSRLVKDDQGNAKMMEGILEDISERKELERRAKEYLDALQSSRASLADAIAQKDRLLSILSHDLRSPFTSILGFCEILLEENAALSAAERSEFLTYIRNSAQQQLSLLNKLLDWSRLESGRIKVDMKKVDLGDICKISVDAHAGTALKRNITLSANVPAGTVVTGDADLLSQVFNNLIGNSLKFTPKGGSVQIRLDADPKNEWVLRVSDSGIGIPEADLAKLFRAEEHYTRRGLQGEAGTGFGLSVVAGIIERHAGTITAKSEVGSGTTFTISLPRWMDNDKQGHGCALIVDDEIGVRALHARYLRKVDPEMEIIQAANGKDGVRLAKERRPRIIVTDYSMPEMNGFQLLSSLKDDVETQDIPVVVITGKESTASMEAMRLKGAAATIIKLSSSAEFFSVIRKVLKNEESKS